MILHQIKMYQSNLINDYLDTFFLCYSNLKYLIDINTTIAIGAAGGNRVFKRIIGIYPIYLIFLFLSVFRFQYLFLLILCCKNHYYYV